MNPAKLSRNLFVLLVVIATLALNSCASGQYCKSWNSPTSTLSPGEMRESDPEIRKRPPTNYNTSEAMEETASLLNDYQDR